MGLPHARVQRTKNAPMPILKDSEIKALIEEEKSIPDGLWWPMKMSERNNHKHKGFEISCESGSRFVVKARQSCVNPMDFSIILGYVLPGSYTVFRLRRYNGKSHRHTNVLEATTFYDFHIHIATERYQTRGFKEDHFAETTNRFYDLASAVQCLIDDCGFPSPLAGTPLFAK